MEIYIVIHILFSRSLQVSWVLAKFREWENIQRDPGLSPPGRPSLRNGFLLQSHCYQVMERITNWHTLKGLSFPTW